jgi:hypothetical protein
MRVFGAVAAQQRESRYAAEGCRRPGCEIDHRRPRPHSAGAFRLRANSLAGMFMRHPLKESGPPGGVKQPSQLWLPLR